MARAVALKVKFEDERAAAGETKAAAFAGAVELVEAAVRRGVKVCVLSNKAQAAVTRTVEALFPGVAFAAVVGAVDGAPPPKPAPDVLLRIIGEAGVDASQVVFVGDTDVDMQTAKGAGVASVGVTWGFRRSDELRRNGAGKVAESFSDLEAILGA